MTTKKVLLSMSGVPILLVLCYAVLHALSNIPPPGTVMRCGTRIFICRATVGGPFLPPTQFQTAGIPTFVAVDDPTNPKGASLRPVEWTGVGDGGQLGEVVWSFDTRPERLQELPNSTIIPNGVGDWPATGDLYFHIVGRIGATGDVEYQSIQPLHLRNNDLHSFYPFRNASFTLVEPVEFTRVDDPNEAVFMLSDLELLLDGGDPE